MSDSMAANQYIRRLEREIGSPGAGTRVILPAHEAPADLPRSWRGLINQFAPSTLARDPLRRIPNSIPNFRDPLIFANFGRGSHVWYEEPGEWAEKHNLIPVTPATAVTLLHYAPNIFLKLNKASTMGDREWVLVPLGQHQAGGQNGILRISCSAGKGTVSHFWAGYGFGDTSWFVFHARR